MINASGPGAVLRKKCREEDEEDEEKEDEVAGRVILNVDVKLLLLCGVRIADLAWAREKDKVVAMAGSRVWGDIVRFGVVVLREMDTLVWECTSMNNIIYARKKMLGDEAAMIDI